MYRILGIHFSGLLWLLWPLRFILRISIQPNNLSASKFLRGTENKDVVFILPRMSLTDIFVLNIVLKRIGLPSLKVHAGSRRRRQYSLMAIKPPLPLTPIKVETAEIFDSSMEKILKSDPRVQRGELVLQPISVFWGRVPERVGRHAIFRLLFPDDGRANPIQKLWTVILHCHNVHVHFSDPVNPAVDGEPADAAKRVRRMLQIEFNRERSVALGPELYEFSAMAADVLASMETKKFIATQSKDPAKIETEIVRYLSEISSSFNYLTALAFERILDIVWTRIFQGIRIRNFEKVAQISKQGSVVWMPSHRSHLDYMVLSYVLKKRGISLPHIAAGINLNFWPIGMILRRSGAFFLRRSFQGNRVYSHTFSQYVSYLLRNGFPIEFFQEGGRTRIGKLLPPKRGMLNMCVTSLLQNKQENCYFVPIYLGFERVMEDDSYARELMGSKKKKESFFAFLASLKNLFKNYGQVDISFGEPIRFNSAWSEFFIENPQYGILPELGRLTNEIDPRDRGVQDFVKHLAMRVNTGVNATATASGTAILASILLTLNEQHISRSRLHKKIELLHWVVDVVRQKTSWPVATNTGADNTNDYMIQSREPTSAERAGNNQMEIVSLPFPKTQNLEATINNIIHNAITWKFLLQNTVQSNDDLCRNPFREENLWWYRGTAFHLFAIPGIVSSILLDLEADDRHISEVEWWVNAIRKLWEVELFWPENTPSHKIAEVGLHILKELGVIEINEKGQIHITDDENNLEHIYFFADLIRPERELYSLQVTAALDLAEKHSSFTKDALFEKVVDAHRAAFLRGAAMQSAQHSQVFGRRVFDALVHVDIFRASENNRFTVSSEKLSPILYFFESTVWREFLK
jgi:glycerol-3-phosphate O-acyltransferase